MRQLLLRAILALGNERAIANARRDSDELMRTLAAVDALALRVAARSAVLRRAA